MTKLHNNFTHVRNTVKYHRQRPPGELVTNNRQIKMFNDLYTEGEAKLNYSVRTIIPSRGIAR